MTFCHKSLNSVLLVGMFSLLAFFAMSVTSQAGIPKIVIKVSDTTAPSGAQGSVLAVYMDNLVDTIAGYNIWLQLDRPDIMTFRTTLDTVGTLCGGWDVVQGTSISGTGNDLNIVGIADYPGGPPKMGILPQQGGLLIKAIVDVSTVPDTLTERTVNVIVQTDFKDHFGLSRPDGTSIPWVYVNQPDTNCFLCTGWIGDVCMSWIRVTYGPCDSISIDTISVAVLDTANVKVYDGSLTILQIPPYTCGNTDGDPQGAIDISDLVYLVEYMFSGGPEPQPFISGDVNCDTAVDIGDLVAMVEYMFSSGGVICPNNCQ